MRQIVIACALAALALGGCKKKEEGTPAPEPTANEPQGEPTAETGDKPAQDESGDADRMKNKMKNCPSAVEGAATSVEKTDTGIKITVAHGDADKLAEIKARAEHLAKVAGKPEPDIKHTGQGTGGGAEGRCPSGIKNTTLKVEAGEGRVIIEVAPMEGNTEDLYKIATGRIQSLGDEEHEHGSGTGGGTGGGGGKGEGKKTGKAGEAAKKDGHEHGSGSGAGKGGGGSGEAKGNKDGTPGK